MKEPHKRVYDFRRTWGKFVSQILNRGFSFMVYQGERGEATFSEY